MIKATVLLGGESSSWREARILSWRISVAAAALSTNHLRSPRIIDGLKLQMGTS